MAGTSPSCGTGLGPGGGMQEESCHNQGYLLRFTQSTAGSDRKLYHDVFRPCYKAGPIPGQYPHWGPSFAGMEHAWRM